MKFACLGFIEEAKRDAMSDGGLVAMMEECWTYDDELLKNGHIAGGHALAKARSAVTLRFHDGRVLVTDGPYAETKEYIGGILILEASDMNEAVELMSKHPGVRLGGPFEIRPIDEERLKSQPQIPLKDEEGAKHFVFLGYNEDDRWHGLSKEELQAKADACIAYEQDRRRDGQWVTGLALQSAATAKTVRFSGGRVIVTDGPFAETKEQLGGLIVLRATDMNHAVELMSKHPGLRFSGPIEVRPLDEEISWRWNARQQRLRNPKAAKQLTGTHT
jgi:hypothetical protein